jgi:hypothetical protein
MSWPAPSGGAAANKSIRARACAACDAANWRESDHALSARFIISSGSAVPIGAQMQLSRSSARHSAGQQKPTAAPAPTNQMSRHYKLDNDKQMRAERAAVDRKTSQRTLAGRTTSSRRRPVRVDGQRERMRVPPARLVGRALARPSNCDDE